MMGVAARKPRGESLPLHPEAKGVGKAIPGGWCRAGISAGDACSPWLLARCAQTFFFLSHALPKIAPNGAAARLDLNSNRNQNRGAETPLPIFNTNRNIGHKNKKAAIP